MLRQPADEDAGFRSKSGYLNLGHLGDEGKSLHADTRHAADMPSTRDKQLPSEATAKKTYSMQTDTLKATAVAKLPTASHQRHVNATIAWFINTALRDSTS